MFIAALRSSLPALSFRVVTDLGDRNALCDFRRQVRPRARELYRYLSACWSTAGSNGSSSTGAGWSRSLPAALPSRVLP